MKLLLLLGAIALGALTLVPLLGEREARFVVTGSSTVAPILQKAAEAFLELHPELVLEVQTGGSTRGIRDAREGTVGAGMASRDLTHEERAGVVPVAIAYDGLALVVHAQNPVEGLSADQVRSLYTGESDDWSAVGGTPGPVTVVNKAEGRATLDVFLDHFGLENDAIEADVVIGDNAQGVRLVSRDPSAIAYLSIGEARHAVESGESIRLLALDGVGPTPEAVADGSYTVLRRLYVIFPGEVDEVGGKLLEFLASPRGREVIESLHFVPAEIGHPTSTNS